MRDDDDIKKQLQSLDFSQNSPGYKERLRRELVRRSRELTENELDNVSAAGDPAALENKKDLS